MSQKCNSSLWQWLRCDHVAASPPSTDHHCHHYHCLPSQEQASGTSRVWERNPHTRFATLCKSAGTEAEIQCVGQSTSLSFWSWLRKGWSRWCLQPHNHKIDGCSSQLWSELTAGAGGYHSGHPIICILGRNIIAAFRKYGKTRERNKQPSNLFPVFLYTWKIQF